MTDQTKPSASQIVCSGCSKILKRRPLKGYLPLCRPCGKRKYRRDNAGHRPQNRSEVNPTPEPRHCSSCPTILRWPRKDGLCDTCRAIVNPPREPRSLPLPNVSQHEALILAHQRLVGYVIKLYFKNRREIDESDLLQEGMIGLCKAADRFDPSRGNRFSTFAVPWIRQAIGRALQDRGREIRIPTNVQEILGKILRARSKHVAEFGVEPSPSQLAEILALPLRSIERVMDAAEIGTLSMNTPLQAGEEKGTIGDLLPDTSTSADALDEVIFGRQSEAIVGRALGRLEERRRQVLSMRLSDEMTHKAIGDQLGVSEHRIRQLEASALRQLRHPSRVAPPAA